MGQNLSRFLDVIFMALLLSQPPTRLHRKLFIFAGRLACACALVSMFRELENSCGDKFERTNTAFTGRKRKKKIQAEQIIPKHFKLTRKLACADTLYGVRNIGITRAREAAYSLTVNTQQKKSNTNELLKALELVLHTKTSVYPLGTKYINKRNPAGIHTVITY